MWADAGVEVEVWIEKSALAGVLYPVTAEFDVPLMPTGGFTSETFAHDAVERLEGAGQDLLVYAFYDFDRSGQDAAGSLREKVERFGQQYGVHVEFHHLGLSYEQVLDMDLPTRPAKRNTTADQRWPFPFAAELDAIPPDDLRAMVRAAIEQHLPADELAYLKLIEAAERHPAGVHREAGGMRAHTLDELLFHMRAIAKMAPDAWGVSFARSMLRQSRRREWHPTSKQEAAMRRLVVVQFEEAGEGQLIEDG